MNATTNEATEQFYAKGIEETIEIVNDIKGTDSRAITSLMNSMLLLVVLPFEKAKSKGSKDDKNRIFPGQYAEMRNSLGVSPEIFQPITTCNEGKPTYSRKTIYSFINKLRNGIAHLNMEIVNISDQETKLRIFNRFKHRCSNCKKQGCTEKGLSYCEDGIIDFEIIVTARQLKKIVLYIARAYLKALKKEPSTNKKASTGAPT